MPFEAFVLEVMLWMCGRMQLKDLQAEIVERLRGQSTSHDTDVLETESGPLGPASLKMAVAKLTGTTMTVCGDQSDQEPSPKISRNHQLTEEQSMVALFRPVDRFMENRFDRVLNRACRQLKSEGKDTRLLEAVMAHAEGAEMLRQESTVACAAAKGVEVQAFGENRPFLEFVSRLIEAGFFREVAEWLYENREKLLEIAKTIAAIIGIFA